MTTFVTDTRARVGWHAAREAALRGWPVFPLVPGGKRPAVRDWERRATCDPARIDRCWAAGRYGVGIACGPAGLVVVDLDRPKPDTGPPPEPWATTPGVVDGSDVFVVLAEQAGVVCPYVTYTVRTPSGGLHLYYTAPAGVRLRNTAGTLGWLVDTRAHGGYVVAAGVDHPTGTYEPLCNDEPAVLPDWLTRHLTTDHQPHGPATGARPPVPVCEGRLTAYLEAAVRTECASVRGASPGGRNAALYMAAQALGQLAATGRLAPDAVRGQLLDAAAGHIAAGAYTARAAEATITSGLRAGARCPRSLTPQEVA